MFAQIGRVASAFGSLELALDEFLTYLMNQATEKPGQIVLREMNSFRSKVRLFKRLVLLRVSGDENAKVLNDLCNALGGAGDRRNDIVHSTYLGIAGEQHKLHQRWPPGRMREKIVRGGKKAIDYGAYSISEEELDAAVDQIEDVEFQTLTFMTERIYSKTEPSPSPYFSPAAGSESGEA